MHLKYCAYKYIKYNIESTIIPLCFYLQRTSFKQIKCGIADKFFSIYLSTRTFLLVCVERSLDARKFILVFCPVPGKYAWSVDQLKLI